MSELRAAAAAALGVPEALVERSAAARAAETGMSVDEVLAAWAGGGEVPASAPPPAEAPAAEEEAPPEEAAEIAPVEEAFAAPPSVSEETPLPEQEVIPGPAVGVATTRSGRPPVLVGMADNPMAVLVGVVALFVAILLVGLVGPALPAESPGARSSDLPYSAAGLRGQGIYGSVGCASCHTQMVRPVVADVDLGAVTLNDSNQVLGTRRFGPDLSNVGARASGSRIGAVITGLGGHPSLALAPGDLDDLVAYLLESRTLGTAAESGAPEAAAGGDEPAGEEPAES
jgi:hypothetical protein